MQLLSHREPPDFILIYIIKKGSDIKNGKRGTGVREGHR